MLIYLKDTNDLRALRIGMGYYFHNEIAENPNKLSSQDLLTLASRFIRIINQLDKELEYYDTTEQEN